MEKIFFAYAALPEATSETLSNAARSLNSVEGIHASTWQQIQADGRVVIDRITDGIDNADLICCELGTLNPNVLFELGYAIAKNKAAWVLLDTSDEDALRLWSQFGLLSSVGYVGYTNSSEIHSRIVGGVHQSSPLWDEVVSASLPPTMTRGIFYMPLTHATDASRTLTRRLERLERQEWLITTADPAETGPAPISWYIQNIWRARAVVIHFAAPKRTNSTIHNARCALIAGIAYGLDKQLLMLAEEKYEAPFDYRSILKIHRSGKELATLFDAWFPQLNLSAEQATSSPLVGRLKLRTALQQLDFYEYVAEQEASTLDEYFVRTNEYESVMSSRSIIFVGRKGVGKTANMLEAATNLGEDRRNFVCVIKPVDYELKGLLQLLRDYQGKESRSYLIENMWKFLIYSELAKTVIDRAEGTPAGIGPTGPVAALRDFIDGYAPSIREDFSLRLEGIVKSVLGNARRRGESIGDARDVIGAALGGVLVRDLRKLLEAVLTDYRRVAILVDNLDKAWDRHADLDVLSQMLLGLLTVVGRVSSEFRTGAGVDDVNFSLAIFLRHDIYQHLIRVAREPDKIKVAAINWSDADFLYRVIDERFIHSRGKGDDARELWSTFFCASVRGISAREYLFARVLPRPRDLLFLVNSAVANAVNAMHEQVSESDIFKAERSYSRFAFEAALVANSITSDKLEELLFEFAGESAFVTDEDIASALSRTGISSDKFDDVVNHLLSLEFIGRETGAGRYSYGTEGPESQRAKVLARKYAEKQDRPQRYRIHPAFCPYLELDESSSHNKT